MPFDFQRLLERVQDGLRGFPDLSALMAAIE